MKWSVILLLTGFSYREGFKTPTSCSALITAIKPKYLSLHIKLKKILFL